MSDFAVVPIVCSSLFVGYQESGAVTGRGMKEMKEERQRDGAPPRATTPSYVRTLWAKRGTVAGGALNLDARDHDRAALGSS